MTDNRTNEPTPRAGVPTKQAVNNAEEMTMTDNRTNGQIVAKALVAHCEDHKMPFPRGSVKKIVEALRVAGRLAGEPTEEQVEAAAKAIADCHNPGMFEKYPENWRVEARAALVAAASAAPVAPQVSESGALTLVEEVIAIHADRIDTHYGDCYKYHVACLAAEVKHRLAGKEKNDD